MRQGVGILGVAACLLLAGCQEQVELTARPPEQSARIEQSGARTPIYVVERVGLAGIDAEIAQLLPERIAIVSERIRTGACSGKKSKRQCPSELVSGEILRAGTPRLFGAADSLVVEVPVAYRLEAKGEGGDAAAPERIDRDLTVRVRLGLTLDEKWRLGIVPDRKLVWSEGAEVERGGRSLPLQAKVEESLRRPMAQLVPLLTRVLQPQRLPELTATTWRHLHYPIEVSQSPAIWLRGDPLEVRFGGVRASGGELEIRAAIMTDLRTYIGERPVPLIPRLIPQLTAAVGEPEPGGVVLPVSVGYDELRSAVLAALPPGGRLSEAGETSVGLVIGDVEVFPSNRQLGLGFHLDADLPDLWRNLTASAYLLADPKVVAGTSKLSLAAPSFAPAAKPTSAAAEGLARVYQEPLGALALRAVDLDLGPRLDRALAMAKAMTDRPLVDDLRLEGDFRGWRIASIDPQPEGLRLTVQVTGELRVVTSRSALASETGTTTPAAASP